MRLNYSTIFIFASQHKYIFNNLQDKPLWNPVWNCVSGCSCPHLSTDPPVSLGYSQETLWDSCTYWPVLRYKSILYINKILKFLGLIAILECVLLCMLPRRRTIKKWGKDQYMKNLTLCWFYSGYQFNFEGALTAPKLEIKSGHLKSRLKSFDRLMPEEIIVSKYLWILVEPTNSRALAGKYFVST